MKTLLGFVLMVVGAYSQQLDVYSEFRLDGPGREIISPAVGRNAFSTFRVVVNLPVGKSYELHLADNPDKAFQYTLYKEAGDKMDKVSMPYNGSMGERKVETFLLDMWVAAGAPVRRVRVEAQLKVDDRWVIYPIEVRVMAATVPKLTEWKGLPGYLCGKAENTQVATNTPRGLVQRNVAQDMLLAKALDAEQGRRVVQGAVLMALGITDAPAWCAAKSVKLENPEQYLRVRDYLLRTALH